MHKLGMNLFGGGSGSSSSPHKEMTTSEFLKEAKEFAKTKDPSKLDPRAVEFAATKIQAGWKGYKTRKDIKGEH